MRMNAERLVKVLRNNIFDKRIFPESSKRGLKQVKSPTAVRRRRRRNFQIKIFGTTISFSCRENATWLRL